MDGRGWSCVISVEVPWEHCAHTASSTCWDAVLSLAQADATGWSMKEGVQTQKAQIWEKGGNGMGGLRYVL